MKKFGECLSNVCLLFVFYFTLISLLFPKYSLAGELKPKVGVTVVESSGNVESISTKLDGELLYEQAESSQALKSGLRYAETEDKKSANSAYIEFKNLINMFGKTVYFYESCKLEGNEFIGYNYRIDFNGGLGLQYKATVDEIRAEIGPGFIYEDTNQSDKGYPSARSFLKYTYQFNERISGSSYFEHVRDLDEMNNHRSKWDTEVNIQLTEGFSLKTNREFSYIHLPPKGSKKHDWITSFALVMNF